MNVLIVGANKSDIFRNLPETFLFIDDNIDDVPLPERTKVTKLDLTKHSFNPLKNIDYVRARQLISIFDASFPEGENTLTKKASNFALLQALLSKPTKLDRLITPRKNDPGTLDAYQKIQTILLSPVLEKFLGQPTNFSFDGILLVRLDRTVLSEFDCFLIANLLISNYKGQIVVPDFGFYGCPFHTSLIRQNRLIAGLNFLDEAPALRNELLLMQTKIARGATADDAHVLAVYSGHLPRTNAYSDFIQKSIGGA